MRPLPRVQLPYAALVLPNTQPVVLLKRSEEIVQAAEDVCGEMCNATAAHAPSGFVKHVLIGV